MEADTHSIAYLMDFNRNGTVDTVYYWIGALSDLAYTQNDSDRILYRKIGPGMAGEVLSPGDDLTIPHGLGYVTKFDMMYYSQAQVDTLAPPVAAGDLKMIKVIQMTIEVQNPYAPFKRTEVAEGEPDALFSSSMWRQTRLVSRNLRR